MNQPHHTQLSTRELQVFRKLAEGGTVSAIAVELGLSVKTVSTYRTRILQKTLFKTNADIRMYAVRHGLIG
jgi:two-component system, NarL family, invasion response regulator UvrY